MRYLSCVCPPHSCIVSKQMKICSKIFHHRVPTPFYFFYTKRHRNILTGTPPNAGVECRWGRLKSRNQRLSGLAISNCCTVVCILHFVVGFLFTVGIGRPSVIDVLLCTVWDQLTAVSRYMQSRWTWIMCMTGLTARLDVVPKTTEQNRIVCTSKSEAKGN